MLEGDLDCAENHGSIGCSASERVVSKTEDGKALLKSRDAVKLKVGTDGTVGTGR